MSSEDEDSSITPHSVASLLAPTLGWEKSEEAVAHAMERLGLAGAPLSAADRVAILDEISNEAGIVGVTARFVRSRVSWYSAPSGMPKWMRPVAIPSSCPPPSSRRRPTIAMGELVPLLAHTMGYEKSEEALVAAARRLRIPTDRLDREQAARLFENLAQQEGLVGLTARFAKARLFVKFGAPEG